MSLKSLPWLGIKTSGSKSFFIAILCAKMPHMTWAYRAGLNLSIRAQNGPITNCIQSSSLGCGLGTITRPKCTWRWSQKLQLRDKLSPARRCSACWSYWVRWWRRPMFFLFRICFERPNLIRLWWRVEVLPIELEMGVQILVQENNWTMIGN